uniref:Ubiquitin n=1 Tax=Solanum tuberosum TaxID=4113 RepID=M1DQW6_SOLTU
MIARKVQTTQRLFQSGESIEDKGIKLPTNNSRFQTSSKEGVAASVHVTGTTLVQISTSVEGKKWVMIGLRDAWRRHKQKIKENFFDKNSTLEDMLAKRPDGIPDNQFRQLIEYWKHPTVQVELQNRQNSGETTDDAFRAVFGKEQPGRLRCYRRSVTTSSLKKYEEINNLKLKHANEITSLKQELIEEIRHLFTPLLQNNPGLNFQDIPGCVGSNLASPVDASSAQAVRGINLSHSSSDIIILVRIGLCIPKEFQLSSSVPEFVDGVLNLPWSFGIVVEPFG